MEFYSGCWKALRQSSDHESRSKWIYCTLSVAVSLTYILKFRLMQKPVLYKWPYMNWLFCPVSQSESLRLPAPLFCSAICTHWQSKPPPPLPIIFCLVLFFVLSLQLLEKEWNVNSLGQGLQQFGYKTWQSMAALPRVLLWPLAVSLEKSAQNNCY